ncbi:MAG: hypothetical protein SGARI_003180 [Bacillariaceae sp.]
MKATMTSFPSNQAGHSIVNSVTEDEDDYVARLPLRERPILPSNASILPPMPASTRWNNSSNTEIQWKNKPSFSQTILPPPPPTRFHSTEHEAQQRMPRSEEHYLNAEAYLSRYERMMNEQEAELAATPSYLQPIFDLFVDLTTSSHPRDRAFKGATSLSKVFTVAELEHILLTIDSAGNDFQSIKTDKQLMMTLRLIVERSSDEEKENATVSLGEVLHCYRASILGSQTLELLPSGSMIRNRAKVRTMEMLETFGHSKVQANKAFSAAPSPKFKRTNETVCKGEQSSKKSSLYLFLAVTALCIGVLGLFLLRNQNMEIHQQQTTQSTLTPTETVSEAVTEMVEEKVHRNKVPINGHANSMSTSNSQKSNFSVRQLTKPALAPAQFARSDFSLKKQLGVNPNEGNLDLDASQPTRSDAVEASTLVVRQVLNNNLSALKTFGGTSAVLYLLVPILTANASWLPTTIAILLATFKGQDIRKWLKKGTKKIVRSLDNWVNA